MPRQTGQSERRKRSAALTQIKRVSTDAIIGPQHVLISNRDGVKKLCWRPHKTLRTNGKMLKIVMLPSLQAALDAMPKPDRH